MHLRAVEILKKKSSNTIQYLDEVYISDVLMHISWFGLAVNDIFLQDALLKELNLQNTYYSVLFLHSYATSIYLPVWKMKGYFSSPFYRPVFSLN